MESPVSAFGVAVIVFGVTNLDDVFILAAFFADRQLRRRAIVAGQFLGIGALTAASAAAAYAALAIPPGWTGLLGVAPLYLGLSKLWALWRERDETEQDIAAAAGGAEHRIEARLRSQALAVAAVTVANGGDNLGVYIPLFATNLEAVPLYAIVFTVLTAAWCVAGYLLIKLPLLGPFLRRWGHIALPLVLIGLGMAILAEARVLLQ